MDPIKEAEEELAWAKTQDDDDLEEAALRHLADAVQEAECAEWERQQEKYED